MIRRPRREPEPEWEVYEWTFGGAAVPHRGILPPRERKTKTIRKPRRSEPRQKAEPATKPRIRRRIVLPARDQLKAATPRLVGLLSLAFWLWASFTVVLTDGYYVPQVTVSGTAFVPAERIAKVAGIPQGYHMFFVDPARVAERIQSLPEIRSVEVRCALPGELTIQVWEREPLFGWRTGSGTFWIDAEGVLMEGTSDYGETLVVEEQTSDERQAGQIVGGEIVRALQQIAVLLPEVKRYNYGPGTGLSFQTEAGTIVFLGTQDLEYRVRLLEALLREASAQGRQLREVHVEYGYPMTR